MHQNSHVSKALQERLLAAGVISADAVARTELVFNLVRFYNRVGQDSERVQRRLGWTWAGFRIMNLLWVAGPLEARQLGRLSGSSRAAMSSVLRTLERDGLVVRDRSSTDRRQVIVRLTDEGRDQLGAGLRAQAECDRAWLGILSPDEQGVLGQILEKLATQRRPDGPDV
ncbi:MarR family winged helix-turn-helix transcriptional regulator [Rhodococcus sp. NPDC056960]|uniref:MarR family winged helix-turn-helix transcriptional regulator n=1 Tax=Rhodococcus TaxID=1827 RepID=UPI0036409335